MIPYGGIQSPKKYRFSIPTVAAGGPQPALVIELRWAIQDHLLDLSGINHSRKCLHCMFHSWLVARQWLDMIGCELLDSMLDSTAFLVSVSHLAVEHHFPSAGQGTSGVEANGMNASQTLHRNMGGVDAKLGGYGTNMVRYMASSKHGEWVCNIRPRF